MTHYPRAGKPPIKLPSERFKLELNISITAALNKRATEENTTPAELARRIINDYLNHANGATHDVR